MIDLTIILPSLYPERWQGIYDNIETAIGDHTWELLVIGPNNPIENAINLRKGQFQYLHDLGTLAHCFNRAMLHAKGEYLLIHADDGIFLPDALNHEFDADMIVTKYIEGSPDLNNHTWRQPGYKEVVPYCRGVVATNPTVLHDDHWTVGRHQVNGSYVPGDWLGLSSGILKRESTIAIGGLDTLSFEICHFANTDLGIRFQRKGLKCKIWPHVVSTYDYDPSANLSSIHKPIEEARVENDIPNYWKIYNDPECVNRTDIPIPESCWLPGEPWKRRYK
jgi:hypothetical protein